MIGCETKDGVEYITKLEYFRDLIDENTYEALVEFVDKDKLQYLDKIDDLECELSSAQSDADMSDLRCDELETELYHIKDTVQNLCKEIQESIDWKYDLYSGYQDMMQKIDELIDKILVKVE